VALTDKWEYSVRIDPLEEVFVAYRLATNERLSEGGVGDLCEKFESIQDAKSCVERWHAENYGDNRWKTPSNALIAVEESGNLGRKNLIRLL